MRLTPNVHVGLVLGIATAGVILALSGCAAGTASSSQPSAAPAATAQVRAQFEDFSEIERARILAVQAIVSEAASENGVDPTLINAVIWVESRFEPKAKSPAGARGLMQLMPSTAAYLAKRMGERNPRAYDPEFNVRAGSLYLSEMITKFGDEQHAVAAYHAGPGNVKRWLETGERFPDYSQSYVAKVMEARARFAGVNAHGRRRGAAGPALAPRPEPKSSSKPAPAPAPASASAIEAEPEPLVVPDVDSLPDAAEIHGVARVVHVRPEPQPEPEPEPVFEAHPELDANPNAPKGWRAAPRRREQAPATERPTERGATRRAQPSTQPQGEQPRPKTPPRDEPDADASQPAGLGVLPDV